MNLANKITLLRIFLVPIFIIIYIFQGIGLASTVIFLIAAITDFLDGYIARSRDLITVFGQFADPLADKILVAAALILFVESGIIPGWTVILIMSREFVVSGFRILASSSNIVIAASVFGKIKTVTQFLAIILILMSNPFFGLNGFRLDLLIYYISVGLTMLSGIDYLVKNKKVLNLENI